MHSWYGFTHGVLATGWICRDLGSCSFTALGPAKPMILYGPSHLLESLQEVCVNHRFLVASQTCWLSSLGPLGSSPTEVQRVEGRLVQFGLEGPTEGSGGGDLVRTWRRLMCCALAEVVSLILE